MDYEFRVGQKVRCRKDIIQESNEHSPAYVCANAKDLVVIRKVHDYALTYPLEVSHEHITNKTFYVSPDEIYESLLDT